MRLVPAAPLAVLVVFTGCSSMPNPPAPGSVTSRSFGTTADGRAATLWTLRGNGIEADVTDYGATLVAVRVPDRDGVIADVVLGFDDVAGYESPANQYFGCTTGRVCNRIAKGKFTLDGRTYTLATNNGPNHLHGGKERSLDKVMWKGEVIAGDVPAVRFTYRSPDGEEGYPGNLDVAVTYTLQRHWIDDAFAAAVEIEFRAATDARTPVNLTNHAYWNLAGEGAATVLDHVLRVDAKRYTPTDDTLIPTGEIAAVTGTPLDFTQPTALGARIAELENTPAKGYDHNFVLEPLPTFSMGPVRSVATLRHPGSGRTLSIVTWEPGLQVYSGNFLNGQRGKGGRTYAHRSAVCLETQHFPDSVNHASFPSTILEPGAKYLARTMFAFAAN